MKDLLWRLQAALFYLFTLCVAALPRSRSAAIGTSIGIFLHNVLHSRRAIAVENIRASLPFMTSHPAWTNQYDSAEEIALATFKNLGISIVEICRLYHGKGQDLIDTMTVVGLDNFHQARAKGKGVLCVSGHCGNWELISLSFKQNLNENVWAIARKQDNPYLEKIVEKMRSGYGNKVIYNKAALRPILSVLKDKGVIGMLTDQAVFAENGALINFLGRTAWANKAPAVIAHKTGTPIVPVFGHRSGSTHTLIYLPEFTLGEDRSEQGVNLDIQALAHQLEDFICAHPADWYWVHRRWKRAGAPV